MKNAHCTPPETGTKPPRTARRHSGGSRRRLLALAGLAFVALAAACARGEAPTPSVTSTPPPPVVEESEPAMPTATPPPAENRATATPTPSEGPELSRLEPDEYKGPELAGTGEWFNSDPTTIGTLLSEGQVVLVDFWTYTCINCLRTLPFLRDWHDKYSDRGLTILGVHAPEFEFEKLASNVADAIETHDVKWAVVQDNDMATWRAFSNRYWPAKYLIGVDGKIGYSHFGEGAYLEMEEQIRLALETAGFDVGDIKVGGVQPQARDPNAPTVTRELYLGYERNYSSGFLAGGRFAGQEEYYFAPDRVSEYTDDIAHAHEKWYLQGLWKNEQEAIVHARETAEPEDYIALRFAARSANVVINPVRQDEPFQVVVEIDDRPLSREEAGADITFQDDGRSVLNVDGARLYRIVEQPQWSARELKLRSRSDNFAVFAFTFGIYDGGA